MGGGGAGEGGRVLLRSGLRSADGVEMVATAATGTPRSQGLGVGVG